MAKEKFLLCVRENGHVFSSFDLIGMFSRFQGDGDYEVVNGLEIDAWLRERIQKVRSLIANMCGYTAWCSIERLRLLFPATF
jgi:hypothetical protein